MTFRNVDNLSSTTAPIPPGDRRFTLRDDADLLGASSGCRLVQVPLESQSVYTNNPYAGLVPRLRQRAGDLCATSIQMPT